MALFSEIFVGTLSISWMDGLLGLEIKGYKLTACYILLLLLTFDITHDLDLGYSRWNVWNSHISGITWDITLVHDKNFLSYLFILHEVVVGIPGLTKEMFLPKTGILVLHPVCEIYRQWYCFFVYVGTYSNVCFIHIYFTILLNGDNNISFTCIHVLLFMCKFIDFSISSTGKYTSVHVVLLCSIVSGVAAEQCDINSSGEPSSYQCMSIWLTDVTGVTLITQPSPLIAWSILQGWF